MPAFPPAEILLEISTPCIASPPGPPSGSVTPTGMKGAHLIGPRALPQLGQRGEVLTTLEKQSLRIGRWQNRPRQHVGRL